MDRRTEEAIANVIAMRQTLKRQRFSEKMVELIVLTTVLEKLLERVQGKPTGMGVTLKKE